MGAGSFDSGHSKPKNTKDTILRLLRYIKDEKVLLSLTVVSVIASTAAQLAAAYMLRPIINSIAYHEGNSSAILLKNLLVMGLIYIVEVIATMVQLRAMLSVSQNALTKIRSDLYRKMQKLPLRFFDTNSNGDLMSRYTNDVDIVGEMLNTTVIQLISSVISFVGSLALMFYTNVWLTIITIVFTPVIVYAGKFIANKGRKYYKLQQEALGDINGYVEETVAGQKVVKVFNHESIAIDEFNDLNAKLLDKQILAQFFGHTMGPVVGNLNQVCYCGTAAIAGIFCVLKGFDVGGLTIFVNYSKQFAGPINQLSTQMNTVFSALAGAERVFKIMDMEPEDIYTEIPEEVHLVMTEGKDFGEEKAPVFSSEYGYKSERCDNLGDVQGEVILNHVIFGYTKEKLILNDVSVYAKKGQKIALVGTTGAGKTTITNLINRFYEIQGGSITIDGRDIRSIDIDTLRKNIALVLQDTHLFTGTVRENIRYGRLDATNEEVIEAAKTANAHYFIERLEDGYDTILEGDGSNLSQGQRQLLNIARAALSKAPILILDEATSSVDTRTEVNIQKGMDALMANRTTFVIAHRLSTIRNSEAIMVLEQGKIIERGNHEQLIAKQGRYYGLYNSLAEE
ncbi:ABC transporter ATP-binding protein [Anaerosporobacter sp.]|uniref:ABC transporter ATP-binding protein n=1 Tax=Anaerosporobacter sp. TaxID=1872529 RepID=UPI00286EECD5|nr:ABC transporter ATP-binding protein [Anaerosporobacter sp.]